MAEKPRIGGVYRHYRTCGLYTVIGIALNTTKKDARTCYDVVYIDVEGHWFTRPLEEWFEIVDGYWGNRFTEVL